MGVVYETDIAESESERDALAADYSDPGFDVRGWEDEAHQDHDGQYGEEARAVPLHARTNAGRAFMRPRTV